MKFSQSEISQLSTWFASHKPGEFVNVLDLIPPTERDAIQDGTSTYDATDAIDAAIDVAHNHNLRGVWLNGMLFNTDGEHIIYDNLQLVGLGMNATTLKLISGVPIDTSMFVTEHYYAGMAQTTAQGIATFGFGVKGMTLHGNKQGIPRVTTQLNGAISDSDTTITVDSTAGFTAPGRLRIASELITYTGMTATSFTGCERGDYDTFPAAYADNETVEYFPMWGGVGLGLFGGQYLIDGVRVENFRNMGIISAYDRAVGGTHNYQNSRDPSSSQYANVPDGDTHAMMHDIEVLNNQLINLCFLGPHDSHVSHFTVVKDGDDLSGEKYLFPVAGIYIGGTGRTGFSYNSSFGTQFSDGHVWGNHTFGIWQHTGGVMYHNVQIEGAHVQFRSSSGNAIGNLRLFGASGARSQIGAWLEDRSDSLTLRIESHDYAGVVLGSMDGTTGYGGGYLEVDGYTNNPSTTTLSAAIDAVQTTIPYTPIVNGPGEANFLPFRHNVDDVNLPGATISFGVPFDDQRELLSFTVGNEEIAYEYFDGSNFYNCVRGYNGTTAEAHDSGDSVFGILHLMRGEPYPSYDPTRGTVIARRHYNYAPIRTRQLESYLRRGEGLTFNETRQAFAIGATPAVTELATKHKLMVSVTETDAAGEYATISTYTNFIQTQDFATRNYYGVRGYVDTSNTTHDLASVAGVRGDANYKGLSGSLITDVHGVAGFGHTAAASTGAITRLAGVSGNIDHAGTGTVTSAVAFYAPVPSGSGPVTSGMGVWVRNQGRAGTTTSYGVRVSAQSGSTDSYAFYAEGGKSLLISGGNSTIPLAIQRNNGQTANLFEFRDHLGAVLSYFDKDGILNGAVVGSVAWTNVTGKPTTLSGYGITDAVAKAGDTMTGALAITYTGGNSLIVNTNDLVVDAVNHRVGFGTATPEARLHTVESTAALVPKFERTSTSATARLFGMRQKSTTTADMIDGFGSGMVFAIQDSAGVENDIAQIAAVRNGADNSGALAFVTYLAGTANERARLDSLGHLGIGTTTPTAVLHLKAGTATANTAPLKFNSGTNLTTPEAGVIEYDGRFHVTEVATRRYVVQGDGVAKVTAGAPHTSDGYIVITVNGVNYKVLTTA